MKTFVKHFSFGIGAIVLTLGAFGAGAYGAVALDQSGQAAAAAQFSTPSVALDNGALAAKSAVLYDLGTGRVLYQKNAYEQLPLASLTKLMSIEVVLSLKPVDTPVQITPADVRAEGDSGFRPGETVTIGDLIKFAVVASSNDAMEAA